MIKKIIFAVVVLIFAGGLAVGVPRYLDYQKHAPQREDYERIATQEYMAVFFSTFPIDHFAEEDYSHYRGIYMLKASYCIPDMETLNEYFAKVAETSNEISCVYLGVRPDIITAQDLLTLMENAPDRQYEIILAYPSLEYWKSLKEEEYPAALAAYTDFVNTIMPLYEDNEWMQENVSLYFYGATEWFVGNPAHYEDDFQVNAGISHSVAMYSDRNHGYLLTTDNYETALENFEELVNTCRTKPTDYLDLSKWDVVFFGDSVIAFSETSSIPGAFAGFTKAHVYNCGIGGSCAADDENTKGIANVVDVFLSKDPTPFPEGSLIHTGMSGYLKQSKKGRQKCFIMEFGLNDFFTGKPVSSDDPYDTSTYMGALRTAVGKLKAAYPDAVILLITPNFTNYFDSGFEPQSDVGGTLPDYVDAVISLSLEENLLLYDSYTDLGIDPDNHTEYLLDGCHPNESTRYRIAWEIAEKIRRTLPADK